MRTSKAVLALGIVGFGLACFGAGRAAKLRFPWAGEALNRPCGKTMLEWKCATGGIRQDKPLKLTHHFALVELSATPKPRGVLVVGNIIRRKESRADLIGDQAIAAYREACDEIFWLAQDRFGEGRGFEDKPFGHWKGIAVGLRLNGKPIMSVVRGKHTIIRAAKRGK